MKITDVISFFRGSNMYYERILLKIKKNGKKVIDSGEGRVYLFYHFYSCGRCGKLEIM